MPRRNPEKRVQDHAAMMRMFLLEGHSIDDIAAELGIGRAQVCSDIEALKRDWRKDQQLLRDVKILELRRIDHIQQKAMRAFEMSVGVKKKTKEGSTDKGDYNETTKWKEAGNPSFLDLALKCCMARAKIEGLEGGIDDGDSSGTTESGRKRLAFMELATRLIGPERARILEGSFEPVRNGEPSVLPAADGTVHRNGTNGHSHPGGVSE